MNIHVVVEGLTERIVYPSWIKQINPNLTFVPTISEISQNNFSVISGGGYPQYFEVIEHAIEDVNIHGGVDRLVISIDSEDFSLDEKMLEVTSFLEDKPCVANIHIIIQHFCLEAWALANKISIPQQPKTQRLKTYKAIHDVRVKDPEALPAYESEDLNRAQFAEKYLRAALNDRHKNLTYAKNNPKAIKHPKYFDRIKQRHQSTDHIRSFGAFLTAFI